MAAVLAMGAPAERMTIRRAVDTLDRGAVVVVAGEEVCEARLLSLFYRRRELVPAWNAARFAPLIQAIRAADADGLQPADYHLAQITTLAADRARVEELDLLLTDAFLLLGSHLLTGRVDPKSVTLTWCLPPRAGDVVAALETALEIDDVAGALDTLRPRHRGYRDLRRALATYRTIAKRGGWTVVGPGAPLRRGDWGERVDRLSARLAATGDLGPAMFPAVFDAGVEQAVRSFQPRHGLDVDGVVGPATVRALDVPVEERIAEIELNLERLRWLPDAGRRFAVINIAAFELLVVEDGRVVLRMGLVVGKPFQRTPVFSSRITEVVFSPWWNIPASISRNEIWPKARRNMGYLKREHIEVTSGGRLRQRPGPWNALGGVKFVAPNDYSVYLHDTPARTLFDRSSRAFSHGCMRLERPLELAAYLLRDSPRWTREAIAEAARAGKERTARVRDPLPLHVLYWTSWVDEAGVVQFREDVYSRNASLRAAMRSAARQVLPTQRSGR